jgi:hypothetical protein
MRTPRARATREGGRHLGGPRHSVRRAERAAEQVVDVEPRLELGDLGRRHDAHPDAQIPLHGDVALEGGHLAGLGRDQQVAAGLEPGIGLHLRLEPMEGLEAQLAHADARRRRELLAHAAHGASRRAGADRALLEHGHVAGAAAGQVVGNAAAHHAAADDQDLDRAVHRTSAIRSRCQPRRPLTRGGLWRAACRPQWP